MLDDSIRLDSFLCFSCILSALSFRYLLHFAKCVLFNTYTFQHIHFSTHTLFNTYTFQHIHFVTCALCNLGHNFQHIVKTPTQPQFNSILVGLDMKMTLHTIPQHDKLNVRNISAITDLIWIKL